MGATYITLPFYRTFRGDAAQPAHHIRCRTEHNAPSVTHQLLQLRDQVLGCHALVTPTDLVGSMTDNPTILHQCGWGPEAPPAPAAG